MERKRILVADDDDDIRQLLAKSLRRDHYEVIEARDGLDLLNMVERTVSPSVIVTDIRMPGLTGLAVLTVLREVGARIPIILMTAHGDDDIRLEAERLGATAFFEKPFDIDDLRTAIINVVERGPHFTVPDL